MDIKSIGMRVTALWREKADVMLDSGRLIAVALLFFGSGILYAQHFLFPVQSFTIRQSAQEAFPPNTLKANVLTAVVPQKSPPSAPALKVGAYVASKNGKDYYKIDCKNRIKEENKIYFQTEGDAKKAGYAPSATCFK